MRTALIGLGVTAAILPCHFIVAAGQVPGDQPTPAQVSKMMGIMRKIADTNARSFARFAQAHALKSGKYQNIMTDYAKDFGGEIPLNPWTDTTTGYTMAVFDNAKQASIAASAGIYCGKWTPKVYRLSLH